MSRRVPWILLMVLVPFAYFAGTRWTGGEDRSAERAVLYWVDPMNPGFRSDAPGIAPCGMPLEPVYADSAGEPASAGRPPGTVHVRPDRQQLIGVRVDRVDQRQVEHQVRLLGRVTADETRVYRLYSVTEGWIRSVSSATTGSRVGRDDVLATYYSQDILGPQQAFLYALDALDRFEQSGAANPDQLELNRRNLRASRQALANLGMSETQIDELVRTREPAQTVELRSPSSAVVLARNVSVGQRFDRTTELFTLADLSRVWIAADVFESDVEWLRPGVQATVRLPGGARSFPATVSPVPPQFDSGSRTMTVRLEVANPDQALRPDMFVDVFVSAKRPSAVVVPASAVLDSGLRKTVYVDRGEGSFEPRTVETGFRSGDAVEITSGLAAGERVVVAGNFLLDSESRMRLASAGPPPAVRRDPVCGMDVDEREAREDGRFSEYGGTTWLFCDPACKKSFDERPEAWIGRLGGPAHD